MTPLTSVRICLGCAGLRFLELYAGADTGVRASALICTCRRADTHQRVRSGVLLSRQSAVAGAQPRRSGHSWRLKRTFYVAALLRRLTNLLQT